MARLAIKGHAIRGKEVIELLEMLGGKNYFHYDGTFKELIYTIGSELELDVFNINSPNVKNDYIVFTIKEFLEKFPYKVGDKVSSKYLKNYKIEKMEWEDTNNRVIYKLQGMGWYSANELQPHKEETMEEKNNDNWAKWDLPDGYEFQDKDGNIINTSVIRLVKKQSQYPNTYEECCRVLDMLSDWHLTFELNNATSRDLCVKNGFDYICRLEAFRKLLICRDAYWKIAGKEMGLDKPWEPDWTKDTEKYVIYPYQYLYSIDVENYRNTLLAFPTREMSNAFYENFKDLIEACKELL